MEKGKKERERERVHAIYHEEEKSNFTRAPVISRGILLFIGES